MFNAKKPSTLTKCASAIAMAALCASMTACGPLEQVLPEAPEPKSVAIVVQNTAGTPPWNVPDEVSDAITEARATNGVVTVTIADGSPTAEEFDFSESEGSSINQDRLQRKINAEMAKTADDEGCDMLKSVEVGAASVAGDDNVIGLYVISNGLCDSGLLDMTSGLVECDPEQVAEFYAAKGELPDLGEIGTVHWYGMGSTGGEQPSPSNAQTTAISTLWDKVLAKSGAALEVMKDAVVAPGEREDAPKVGIVPFETILTFDTSLADQATKVEFTPTQLGFVGDSCEFVDAEQARAALSSVADTLRDNPQLHATVVASSATHPKEGYSQQLSEDRANAVRDTLVSMSVPESQISAKGIGSGEPDDIDTETGLQIPEKSAAKRRVTIEIVPE
jgi:outer membrane protein OmpA-like peptidoglycan-associated protein